MAETASPETLSAEFITSLGDISADAWNAVAQTDYPFLRHDFLYGLEKTNCTTPETGWQPCHLLLRSGDKLVAVMPQYLKGHSYGEYVFDWSWADAWRRSGLEYYPKLVSAIPFTPATGPRLCFTPELSEADAWRFATNAVQQFATERKFSSWHVLFPHEHVSELLVADGLPQRAATQFHWYNEGYTSFDDFLATFTSRKRKSLKRERRRVQEQGVTLTTRTGNEITAAHWETFHQFYQLTYAKRSGHGGYLSREFFLETAAGLGDQVVMVLAEQEGSPVAGALYFRSSDTLFGRYWGCVRELDCLHFEACYYQGIDYCIEHGIKRFDPGAQGEHKIQRGFTPTVTWSNHWIADPALAAAVEDFTRREAENNEHYRAATAEYLPFKAKETP